MTIIKYQIGVNCAGEAIYCTHYLYDNKYIPNYPTVYNSLDKGYISKMKYYLNKNILFK